jgi:hypothetical protein
MKNISFFKKAMIAELPYKTNPDASRQKITDLNLKYSNVDRLSGTVERYRDELKEIHREIGLYVDYNAISDNKEYIINGELVEYTLSVVYSLPIPERFNDGADERHNWLVSIGAVSTRVRNDHEWSQDWYYFSSETAARNFIDRINATFHYLNFLKLI